MTSAAPGPRRTGPAALAAAPLAALLLAACASSTAGTPAAQTPIAPGSPSAQIDAAAAVAPQLAGCPLFPASNAWRRDISHAARSRYSAAWVRSVGLTAHLHPDFGSDPSYGIPYRTVPAGQAKVPIRFTAYGDESDRGPYPVPLNAPVEAGSDRHVLIASADCHLYELYGARRSGRGWSAQSGAVFDLRSNTLRHEGWTSADAAGLPILPGLVRPDEIRSGHIDHALRFTVARTQRGWIHPATHQAGSTSSTSVPPMGARFRLKASFSLAGYHGAARVILTCLKRYGMFVADNGSNWFLSGASSRSAGDWNDDDLNQLKRVPGSAFEVVDTGAVRH